MTNKEFQILDTNDYFDSIVKFKLKNGDMITGYILYYSYQEEDDDTEFDSVILDEHKGCLWANEVESVEIKKINIK